MGLRFDNLALPPGSVIESASVQFAADEAQSEATSLTIRAQAADSAALFTTNASNLSARPLTAASVLWSPAAWASVDERGSLQRSPDVSVLVREVIARPGWTNGGALAFLITGIGHRTADAADDLGGSPATLTVNYRAERALGSYARWAASRTNVTALTADLDLDGYQNLFEYALGLNPAVPDHEVTPLVIVGNTLHFTYTRPTVATDVSYQVEWASTLASPWSSTGVTQQILSDDGVTRTIRATLPKGVGTQRFVRLKVTQ